jgi:outer membrane protein OmpA-like peptidoglycan-associated protein
MKPMKYLVVTGCAVLIVGCAATLPPMELITAREAYRHARASSAAELVPTELYEAREALAAAENSYQYAPNSYRTRDLAYVADRKARTAEALATAAYENARGTDENKNVQAARPIIVKQIRNDVTEPEGTHQIMTERLSKEHKVRLEAEKRAVDAQARLVNFGAVKEEPRGLVITISGKYLFASDKWALLPGAQDRLNDVADVLMASKDRRLTVEGHPDSQGSANDSKELSQARADVVRLYLISRGYPADRIEARAIGDVHMVAGNGSAGGRANSRRVEIIAERASK